jgi:uncharacterized repeat protein (TIGR02543 family)
MGTNNNGNTFTSNISPGIRDVTNSINSYNFTTTQVVSGFNDWCWLDIKSEIDNDRPFVWSVLTGQGGGLGHSLCAFGYDDLKYVICRNTWDFSEDWWPHNQYDSIYPATTTYVDKVWPGGGSDDIIYLDAPIGGEVRIGGTEWGNGVVWTQDSTRITLVEISLSTDEGASWSFVGASPSHQGWNYYTWQIPNIDTSTARIRILGWDSSDQYIAGDGSFGNFTIQASYQITVTTSPPGLQVTVDGITRTSPYSDYYPPGQSITIRAPSPQSGGSGTQYAFSSWSDGGLQTHQITPTADGTYTANFGTRYYLTTSVDPSAGGTISPASGWYTSGATVQVQATPAAGYYFTGWSGDLAGTQKSASIAMTGPRTVTANFARNINVTITTSPPGLQYTVDGITETSPSTITVIPGSVTLTIGAPSPQSGGSGTQYAFSSWSDGGLQTHQITPTADGTYTANFGTRYYLTTSVDPSAGGTISPASGWYTSGATVQVQATPAAGYYFTGWSGDLAGTQKSASIAMTGPRTVTANFARNINVTITTSPPGLQYTVDGITETSPSTITVIPGSVTLTIGAPSPQSGGSGTQYAFSSWSDGGLQTHQITPTADGTYTANFGTRYYLTTSVDPSAGGTISPASGWYTSGATVQVQATPAAGYYFTGWSGDLAGTQKSASIAMTGPRTVTANFARNINVTITTSPPGLQYTVDGITETSPSTITVIPGSVTLTIGAPSPQSGGSGTQYAFSSWSDGGLQTHQITPTADGTYTANFGTRYYLTTSVDPSAGGTISPASGWYTSGATVQVQANAFSGYAFYNWSGDASGSQNPFSTTMDRSKTLLANFIDSRAYPPKNPNLQRLENNLIFFKEYINRLSWQANEQNTVQVTKYRVYAKQRGSSDGSYVLIVEVPSSSLGYDHRGLKNDDYYTYRITAVNIFQQESQFIEISW